jgi:hypothetical protein
MSPAPTRAAVLALVALSCAAGAVAGCDERRPTGDGEAATTSPYGERNLDPRPVPLEMPAATRPASWTMPFPPTTPKPGYARGRVVGQNGKPVEVPGVRISIKFYGVSHEAGTKRIERSYDISAADGQYEVKLEPGTYRPIEAIIEVPFSNRYYKFDLHPLQETFGHGTESSEGLVQDFVWKLTGLKPKQPNDPTREASWYGATLQLRYVGYREDLRTSVPGAPQGTKLVFTLKPLTPLADGTPGRTITFERTYSGPLGLDNPVLTDIPLARYALSAEEHFPGPDRRIGKALILGEDGTWGFEAQGTFGSDLASKATERVVVRFSRPIE